VRSPSNRAWHRPGAARLRASLLGPGACCRICGSTDRLEPHHIVPARAGGPTTAVNLAVLCNDHHLAVERGEISLGALEAEKRS
jgi:5-methylcytosine-specific restriction endonuclease McrA